MLWVLAALFEPFFHSISNLIDSHVVNKHFSTRGALFYSSISTAIIALFILIITRPALPDMRTFIIIAGLGVNSYIFMWLYLRSLQTEDTSVVAALFDLGKIAVPVLAFLIVGERLNPAQYIFFVIIVAASIGLTYERHASGQWRIRSSFWLMLLCSILLALDLVVMKYILGSISWNAAIVWVDLVYLAITAAITMLVSPWRRQAMDDARVLRTSGWLLVASALCGVIGLAGRYIALTTASATLVEGVVSVQPLIVLGMTVLAAALWPHVIRERVDVRTILKKFFWMLVLVGAVYALVMF